MGWLSTRAHTGAASAAFSALALALGHPGLAAAQHGSALDRSHIATPRVAAARAAGGPITVDGRLHDSAWSAVEPISGFTQVQPHEGEPATQRTEIRFLFDRDALYIGARMVDSEGAAGVRGQLVRRDTRPESDWIEITFDTFHDHLGQVQFATNPSGVRGDAYGPGGSGLDQSWDGVGEVATQVDSLGWTAEFRIPFAQLRYPRDSVQTWGLQVRRLVHRLNELSMYAFWRLNESGGPTRYAHLEGIHIGRAPGRMELMPYVVGRQSNVGGEAADPFYRPRETSARFGADLKYLLNSNLTLTATFNPDFGQVEVDPAVVNLSAYETYFEERRPFFIEGRGLFSWGWMNCYFCSNVSGLGLFYSRRIGRSPQGTGNAFEYGEYADIPENTRILGAAKITGRLTNGTSIGILNAVSAREHAAVARPNDRRVSVEVEPLSNYFVGRIGRDFAGGNGQLRFIGTSVVRDLRDSALATQLTSHSEAAGVELNYYWHQRTYRLMANFALAEVAGDSGAILSVQRSSARYFQRPDRQHGGNGLFSDRYDPSLTAMRGWSAYARLGKNAGDWLWELNSNFRSPGFEANDLAFNSRADFLWMGANLVRQVTRPNRVMRSGWFDVGGQQGWNFDGDLTERQMQAYAQIQTLGYWNLVTYLIYRPRRLDDRLARGGPVLAVAPSRYWYVNISTDSRKPVALGLENSFRRSDGRSGGYVSVRATLRPASNVSLSMGPMYDLARSRTQWVTAVDDPTATAFYGRRYVFADLDQRTLSMDTRLNVTFTPTLTLELYAQPLIVSGAYTDYKEYDRPRSTDRAIYGRDRGTISRAGSTYTVDPDGSGPAAAFSFEDRDFNFRSLRGNAVVRWEFRPGSTLFLVWTQRRSGTEAVGNLDLGRDVDGLFAAKPDNIFLVKISYWMGL